MIKQQVEKRIKELNMSKVDFGALLFDMPNKTDEERSVVNQRYFRIFNNTKSLNKITKLIKKASKILQTDPNTLMNYETKH